MPGEHQEENRFIVYVVGSIRLQWTKLKTDPSPKVSILFRRKKVNKVNL